MSMTLGKYVAAAAALFALGSCIVQVSELRKQSLRYRVPEDVVAAACLRTIRAAHVLSIR